MFLYSTVLPRLQINLNCDLSDARALIYAGVYTLATSPSPRRVLEKIVTFDSGEKTLHGKLNFSTFNGKQKT